MSISARQIAATERRSATAQLADRPRQRRGDEAPGQSRGRVVRPADIEVRASDVSDSGVHFIGHASTVEDPYEMWDMFGPYTEVADREAFDVTLNRADLDTPLVLGHDQMRRIARTTTGTLTLSMDDAGLLTDAPNLDMTDHDVAYIVPKLRAGLISEMSFAFRIVRGVWSPDYSEYRLMEVDIHRGDVAIVGYGANPGTDGGLREQRPPDTSERARALLALALAQ